MQSAPHCKIISSGFAVLFINSSILSNAAIKSLSVELGFSGIFSLVSFAIPEPVSDSNPVPGYRK